MELWYPQATRVEPKSFNRQKLTRHEKQVLHTTESKSYSPNSASYYGHQLWPTATAAKFGGRWQIFQHLPINIMSAAMRNLVGGVETNRDGCVQLEIAWVAAEGHLLPTEALDVISDWMWFVHQETGIPWVFVDQFHYYPPENGIKLGQEPWRLRGAAWDNFKGNLGHQHADENVHGDPGKMNVGHIIFRHLPIITPPPIPGGIMQLTLSADKLPEVAESWYQDYLGSPAGAPERKFVGDLLADPNLSFKGAWDFWHQTAATNPGYKV